MSTAQHLADVGIHDYKAGLEGNLILIGDTLELEGGKEIFKEIDDLDVYDKRFLVLSDPGDFVVVREGGYDPAQVEYLNSVGFGTDKDKVIVARDAHVPLEDKKPMIQYLKENPSHLVNIIHNMEPGEDYTVHSYHYSDEAADLADLLETDENKVGYSGATTEMSRRFNNKVEFKKFAEELGIPVAPGMVVYKDNLDSIVGQLEDGIDRYGNKGEVYMRGEYSASGSSSGKVNRDNLMKMARKILNDESSERFLLERKLDYESNPSINVRITDDDIYRLNPISGQILSGTKHMGNVYPAGLPIEQKMKILDQSKSISEVKKELGYRGDDGYDFGVLETGEVFPIENNARVTGAAPGAHLKARLEERHGTPLHFATINYKAHRDSRRSIEGFNHLADALKGYNCTGTLLYDGDRPSGVVPVFKGNLAIFAPSPEEFKEIGGKTGEYVGDHKVSAYFR